MGHPRQHAELHGVRPRLRGRMPTVRRRGSSGRRSPSIAMRRCGGPTDTSSTRLEPLVETRSTRTEGGHDGARRARDFTTTRAGDGAGTSAPAAIPRARLVSFLLAPAVRARPRQHHASTTTTIASRNAPAGGGARRERAHPSMRNGADVANAGVRRRESRDDDGGVRVTSRARSIECDSMPLRGSVRDRAHTAGVVRSIGARACVPRGPWRRSSSGARAPTSASLPRARSALDGTPAETGR